MPARVLSIGNCAADNAALKGLIEGRFDAQLTPVAGHIDARRTVQDGDWDLILVNRVGDADGASGLDLIAWLTDSHPDTPCMLLSNFPDAQQQAQQAGARPGFGKAALAAPETLASLEAILPSGARSG